MTEYRRPHVPGAAWFFTVGLAERRGNWLLVDRIDALRAAFRRMRMSLPFWMEAVAILPDHLHCLWTLPPGDSDVSTRWNLIKGEFSRAIEKGERISPSRAQRGERGIWQRRFWDHLIRDHDDLKRHPLESGEARMGRASRGLAAFQFPCLPATGRVFRRLGWRERRAHHEDRGMTKTMGCVPRTMRCVPQRILSNVCFRGRCGQLTEG